MTHEFEYLMHLMAAASHGTPARPPRWELDWKKLSACSRDQMLTPMVLDILAADPSLGCPRNSLAETVELATVKTMKECAKRMMVIDVLADMERSGIHNIMVKGAVAAVNYAYPEKRFSTDTDICVAPEDEERACQFLRDRGFEVTPRWDNGHHASAMHEAMGVVEVHVRLYDEIVEELWFGEIDPETFIQEPHQRVRTAEGWCNTLGDTDHLIFIILHMIKHFISGGMALRMMMDTALFIKKHREHLDLDRVWSTMKQLKFDRLLSAVLWAMVRYCDFEETDFPGIGPEEPEQIRTLLEDLEAGGFMGYNDQENRSESAREYNRVMLMKEKNKLQYWWYMVRAKHSFKLHTFFPGRNRLAKEYPCVKKHGWLIPFVWIHRWITYGYALIFKKKLTGNIVFSEDEISDVSKKRIAMFRSFGMLEQR